MMDENKRESSSSTEGCGMSPKRRKTDDPVDLSASNKQTEHMSLSHKSSPITTTRTRLDQIRTEINNLFDEERQILEDEAQSYKLANQNLKLCLAESVKYCQVAKAAQVAAEAQISQLKIEMDEKITELLQKNSGLEKRMIDQAIQDTAKLIAAKNRIIKLEQEIKSTAMSQEKFKLKATKFQEANMEISKLELDRECLWEEMQDLLGSKELGDELQSTKDCIAAPRGSLKEKIPDEVADSDDKKSNNAEKIKEMMVFGEYELSPVLVKDQLENSKEDISYLQESKMREQKSQQCEILRAETEEMTNGNAEHGSSSSSNDSSVPALASYPESPEFFEIDWTMWYQQRGPAKYNCKKCGKVKKSKTQIEDHIWDKHHGGYFICPCCTDFPVSSSRRNHIKRHIKKVHQQK